ncbi:MAG: nicotinate phosphoribosyltransferase [Cyclobacteriaceae bacterium]
MKNNLILLADAYKYSHHKLYYPGTTHIYSYLESRGGKFEKTVFYGLQYFLKEYLEGIALTQEELDEAVPIMEEVFGRDDVFDPSVFQYIIDTHGGRLPVRIKAVTEGAEIPVSNVLMTIENTDPNCFWLTNFLETLLMQIWYPCTVATLSHEIKKLVKRYYDETATEGAESGIDFVLNDFGFRGVSSVESAGIGGSAHLLSFSGSDNIAGSVFAKKYYGAESIPGMSIPATEHSVCTLLGKEGEQKIYQHILDTYPTGTIACVSDSYNIFEACEKYWGETLRAQVLNRDGTLVIRPDSGDPVRTLLEIFEILFNKFGFTTNAKGYRVLPPQIRVIQGDGVNYDAINNMLEALKEATISTENLVLGMGGALLQKLDRDTQKFAIKCSHAVVNGKEVTVQKNPVEMDAAGNISESFKKSKGGKLKLIKTADGYRTVGQSEFPDYKDELITVFENGLMRNATTYTSVKQQLAKTLDPASGKMFLSIAQ